LFFCEISHKHLLDAIQNLSLREKSTRQNRRYRAAHKRPVGTARRVAGLCDWNSRGKAMPKMPCEARVI
jgi:hypothetical protein